ncbi:MAG: glycoside hydrolase family 31 protein [Bryobacteraceae bacterium]|jgi:alpha-D-xyloside xylohydrolase
MYPRSTPKRLPWLLLPLIAGAAYAQWNPLNPVVAVRQEAAGVELAMRTGVLRIDVCSASIIRARYSPTSSLPSRPDYVVTKTAWPAVPWKMESTDRDVTLVTSRLRVTVNRADGGIAYRDSSGKRLLQEGTRNMYPAKVNGEDTFHAELSFGVYASKEAFYGLGQQQAGVWNYRGESVDLSQDNTVIAVPLVVSTNGYGLFWNNTSRSRFNARFVHGLYLSSEVADAIDYYFFYGPDFDSIIAAYRELTGAAPLFGKWAYGFWQSKNRYRSQRELVGVARQYRQLHIPVDNIVQDWFWWDNMGSFRFNKDYPDPKAMIDDLHRLDFHLMISAWPYFYPGSAAYDDMDKRGFFLDRKVVGGVHPAGMALYDAMNPEARAAFWSLMDKALFKIGADAWWLDTTEPETSGREENIITRDKTGIGSGARYANIFPLLHAAGVSEGQRSESDRKRVFILSRSAFAGIQRYGVAAWSGDVASTFETFKRQIPAGLNFSLSGIPYWTTDIGGFYIGNPDDPAYRELFVRWFQYGTFCPIFRVHGTRSTDPAELAAWGGEAVNIVVDSKATRGPSHNELWSYGPGAQKILTTFDRLRYRLLPYIYSLAWKTSSAGYTPMRALVMDFAADPKVMNIGDQFMFGPAILVNPVTEQGATTRHLYLPVSGWYDFWTGSSVIGGRMVDAAAPLDRLPLFIRAGSIVPMGPDLEYASEKPADPIELRVYTGASGDFALYEDENDNYNYEKAAYATIAIHWDDGRKQLTIGERQGSFPGMLASRTFRVVFVGPRHGEGTAPAAQPDKIVPYSGKAVTVAR